VSINRDNRHAVTTSNVTDNCLQINRKNRHNSQKTVELTHTAAPSPMLQTFIRQYLRQ